jgi:hypothetical protein
MFCDSIKIFMSSNYRMYQNNCMLPKLLPIILLCSISIFCTHYCVAQEKIYFQPKAALASKQSDFIDVKGIIIFETTAESKFDKYSKIISTKNYFIVCDYSAKKILVFSKEGRFIKKLKNKLDLGRLNYNQEKNRLEVVSQNKMFSLTNKDKAQILEDFNNPKNYKYYHKYFIDFTDSLNFAVHKQKISGADMLNPIPYNNGMHIINQITVDKDFKQEEDYELKIYKGDSLQKQFFPYKKKNDSRYIFDGGAVAVTATATRGIKWVTHPYDYTIYALQNDSLYKVYNLVLPIERAVPADFFNREFQNKTDKTNYLRQNKKLIKQLYVYSHNSRYINLGMQGLAFDNESLQYIYDTQTKNFYDYEKIASDSATYYLPICKNRSFIEGGLLYAKINAEDVLEAFSAHKKDSIAYPPLLQAYQNIATPDSNPILINYTFRN